MEKIVCLVRADDDRAAEKRVKDGLKKRGFEIDDRLLEIYAADLTKPELGLSSEVYTKLVDQVDIVIHVSHALRFRSLRMSQLILLLQAAWPVHFGSSLVSFEDNIKGGL